MLRTIIVDDEERSRDVLENLLNQFCDEVEIVAKCDSVLNAVEAINQLKPDLVFLDIEMPVYVGYELFNYFPKDSINFNVIFVTAYEKYAIQAFELAALDYLLKPIEVNRLKMAVERASREMIIKNQMANLSVFKDHLQEQKVKSIVITDKAQQHILSIESIIAIEAQVAYCNIHTTDKTYMVSKNLMFYEKLLLDVPQIIRVHKSWLINSNHVLHYSKSDFSIQLKNNVKAKLSKYKKAEFEKKIAGM